jgi:hypothetical protein
MGFHSISDLNLSGHDAQTKCQLSVDVLKDVIKMSAPVDKGLY